ncbi:MAG: hypothetical protein N2316_08085 [Spirochaetes bacterium]|nr:hypothetical protein [Spirochaetota bacterium]
MKHIVFIACLIVLSGTDVDYRIEVSYHAKLVKNKEWSIAVLRKGEEILIKVNNYHHKSIVATLHRDEYSKLLEFLNKAGIWHLKSYYPVASPNAYYRIEVQQGKYTHVAVAEAGPLLSGDAIRFREIIRKMENLAKRKLEK